MNYKKNERKINLRLNVLSSCNLRCKHCYYDKKVGFDGEQMSLKNAKEVVDQAYSIFGKKLHIVLMGGGEPALYKYFYQILEYIRLEKNITCAITSNLTLFGKNDFKKLRDLGVHIHASIEGKREYNDYVRGEGVFTKVLENTKLAKQIGVFVSINMTLNKYNISHIPYILKLFEPYTEYVTFSRYIPYYKDEKIKELSSKEYLIVQKILEKYSKFYSRQEMFFRIDKNNLLDSYKFGLNKISSLYILPDMSVYPSWNLIDYKLGNLKKNSLEDIIYNGKLEKLYNPLNLKNLCYKCKYKYNCGGDRGVAYFYTGDFWGDDLQCPYIINNKLVYN